MRIRTFSASDMAEAMRMIRESLGDDAIIISADPMPQGKGVSVTAASEPETFDPSESDTLSFSGKPVATTSGQVLAHIEAVLRFHAATDEVIHALLETARRLCLQGRDIRTDMIRLMAATFQYAPLPLDQEHFTLMLVGPPGTGKTMTIAKMASQCVMDKKGLPVVITTDNKRAGGVEQLTAFTTILGLTLHVADNRGELWRMLKEFSPRHRILIDTGGVNPFHAQDIKELQEYITLDRTMDPVLVSAAGSDAAEAEDMARAFQALGVRRMLITRIDAARRYGSILTAGLTGKFALCHASNSSRVIGEFTNLDPAMLTELLLRYQLSPRALV